MGMGFHSMVKRRVWAFVLMLSMIALHIYLTFSMQQQVSVGTLHSGNYAVIRAMERTFDNALPRSDRDRSRMSDLFESLSGLKIVFERIDIDLFCSLEQRAYGLWNLLVGRALTSEPRSELILRI